MDSFYKEGRIVNEFTVSLRDALLHVNPEDLKYRKQQVEFAGKTLKVGRYGRPKGFAKAFLIVSDNGNVYYLNKQGVLSNRLTPKAFEAHWNSGMNTYLGSLDSESDYPRSEGGD